MPKQIALTFDDAVSNHRHFVAPLLREYGFGATFFVCEFPPDFASNPVQYMNWREIAELDAMGFEIGHHTMTHPDLHTLDATAVDRELAELDAQAAAYGIRPMTNFAYPGGPVCAAARGALTARGFRFARTCQERCYEPGVSDPLELPAFPVHGEDFARFEAVVRQADGVRIPVLVYHGVPEHTHPWVSITPETFEREMRYLRDHDFHVVALRDLP